MSLEQIIKACQNGDYSKREQLYRIIASELYAICLKYSQNQENAKDNLHDGFINLFNKIHQYEFKGSFMGWAKRLMINQCLQEYKKTFHLETIKDIHDKEDDEIEINDNLSYELLLSLIQDLPNQYRHVFNLYVLDGYSHSEISEFLGISEGTSKSNLSRARNILKTKIETYQLELKKKVN